MITTSTSFAEHADEAGISCTVGSDFGIDQSLTTAVFPGLPEDVLTLIFYDIFWALQPHQRCASPPTLPLSHVSRRWRNAAIANKSLWSYIPTSSPEFVTLFLRRSDPVSVSVYIPGDRDELGGGSGHRAAVEEILHHTSRVRVFVCWAWAREDTVSVITAFGQLLSSAYERFSGSSTIEVLGSHDAYMYHPNFAQIATNAHLRSLTLGRVWSHLAQPVVCVGLRSLCLYQCDMFIPSFRYLMLSVPHLQELVIFQVKLYPDQREGHDPNETPLHLPPSLRSFRLAAVTYFVGYFLSDKVRLPAQTSFAAHVVDSIHDDLSEVEDPGPPNHEMDIPFVIIRMGGHSQSADELLSTADDETNDLNRCISSFKDKTSLSIDAQVPDSLELIFECRADGNQTPVRGPFSFSTYWPGHGEPLMASKLQYILSCIRMPPDLSELRVGEGLTVLAARGLLEGVLEGMWGTSPTMSLRAVRFVDIGVAIGPSRTFSRRC